MTATSAIATVMSRFGSAARRSWSNAASVTEPLSGGSMPSNVAAFCAAAYGALSIQVAIASGKGGGHRWRASYAESFTDPGSALPRVAALPPVNGRGLVCLARFGWCDNEFAVRFASSVASRLGARRDLDHSSVIAGLDDDSVT